ncbi:MAG: Sua5/YciO/YrdC/YwlC family protein, partial [Candidatus Staskawiczbacteria bacterium]|nr:Sua5/YciO/YrdC/YwlC family protein [Candidatus Staskawiczbacteria bacterium]
MERDKMNILKPSKQSLNKVVETLQKGGVVVCPTDTVYGFLADATDKKAVNKIYKIKKRPKTKPLPIFVRDFKMAKDLAEIDKEQEKIINK